MQKKDLLVNEVTKEEKTYTVTIKFTENDVYGKQIKPSQTKVLTSEDYKNGTFFTIEATKYSKSGTLYEPVMNKHGKQIVLVDENPQKDQNGTKTFKIKKLPEENLTITIVYSVYQHNILANYYSAFKVANKYS